MEIHARDTSPPNKDLMSDEEYAEHKIKSCEDAVKFIRDNMGNGLGGIAILVSFPEGPETLAVRSVASFIIDMSPYDHAAFIKFLHQYGSKESPPTHVLITN